MVQRIKAWLAGILAGILRSQGYVVNRRGRWELTSQGFVTTGEHTITSGTVSFKGREDIRIGRYSALGEHVFIVGSNHDYELPANQSRFYRETFDFDNRRRVEGKVKVVIGNDVYVGDNSTLLPGVEIGDGAFIGAGSIVTRDIPPYAVAVGIPARLIKHRFREDIISLLLELKWWDWPEEKIKRNREFFTTRLNDLPSVDDIRKLIK